MRHEMTAQEYLSKIGKKGGSKTSKNKKASSAYNGKHGMKPHFQKVKVFLKQYPYELESMEWVCKIPLVVCGKKTSYNPDFYCKTTDFYIEVATSKPNISEQRLKWTQVIIDGHKLKIFWWTGQEITEAIMKGSMIDVIK